MDNSCQKRILATVLEINCTCICGKHNGNKHKAIEDITNVENVKNFNQKLEMLRKNNKISIQLFFYKGYKCRSVVAKNTILKKSKRETMEKGVLITGQTCQSSAVSEMIPRWCTGRRAHCPMFWCSVYLEHLFQDRASRFSSG